MKFSRIVGTAIAVLAVVACTKKDDVTNKDAAPSVSQASAPTAALPDAGKLTTVSTTATGVGGSAAEAVDDAIKLAIKQVNGVAVDMSSEQFKMVLSVAVGRDAAQLQAQEFSEYVAKQSGGVVTSFKVLKLDGPEGNVYKASIEANIAKFNAPVADSRKLKIVVGPIRFNNPTFQVAGVAVPSEKIAEEVRQQILDALTNTGRFSVLDRDLGDDVQQELDMISSGQAPAAERSKMSQAISADLIWTGQLNTFDYQKSKGSWSISQRVINVATRQVQLSNILKNDTASVGQVQSDKPANADVARQGLESQLVRSVVSAILVRTFPITVASRDGNNVVLSQGGQSVREGSRYLLVSMGQEIKDPQTGQSLGRTEYDCCEVVIDRVGPTMSQGHLENIRMPLEQIQPGGLQLRELRNTAKASEASAASSTASKHAHAKKAKPTNDIFASDKDKW
ncbi:CsgG/HfaB family protein [Neisseriaceae bacterium JH1-16]|nr:CsgG/HfaB family protein [Neisseriaceae bacterium JH1-16]